MANEATRCFHGILCFGQGGYEIVCKDCGVKWIAVDADGEPDFEREELGLGESDVRMKPEKFFS
jgi:hypothetical protein